MCWHYQTLQRNSRRRRPWVKASQSVNFSKIAGSSCSCRKSILWNWLNVRTWAAIADVGHTGSHTNASVHFCKHGREVQEGVGADMLQTKAWILQQWQKNHTEEGAWWSNLLSGWTFAAISEIWNGGPPWEAAVSMCQGCFYSRRWENATFTGNVPDSHDNVR